MATSGISRSRSVFDKIEKNAGKSQQAKQAGATILGQLNLASYLMQIRLDLERLKI